MTFRFPLDNDMRITFLSGPKPEPFIFHNYVPEPRECSACTVAPKMRAYTRAVTKAVRNVVVWRKKRMLVEKKPVNVYMLSIDPKLLTLVMPDHD